MGLLLGGMFVFKKKGLREKTTSTNSRCAGVPTVDMEKVNILILDMNLVQ